jgi:hypothetical protein
VKRETACQTYLQYKAHHLLTSIHPPPACLSSQWWVRGCIDHRTSNIEHHLHDTHHAVLFTESTRDITMSDTTIQAKVTLTSLTVGIFPSTRILYLHEYNETIPIGRSSKNPLKHLVAAADNCWVDSDVVSRDHAQLKFDADVETIFIEDTMSMHGTRINNKQIPKNDPIPLANNDVVSLGAEVKRGIEVYPECRFRVNFELLPYM